MVDVTVGEQPKSFTKSLAIPGGRKAAILLVSIDQDSASKIFAQMEHEDIERISLEIAKRETNPVSKVERDSVLEEFHHIYMAQQYVEQGGMGYARQLLERVLPPEDVRKVIDTIEQSMKMSSGSRLHRCAATSITRTGSWPAATTSPPTIATHWFSYRSCSSWVCVSAQFMSAR